jgi:sporulation protein YlmC with PRC-barrel domain
MKQHVMKDLKGEAIAARDGDIGSVKDVYFDDEKLAVRYLVLDTGGWITGRRVLLSPANLGEPVGGVIPANLSRRQVEEAPGIDEHLPVSRLYERAHAHHYRYPYYWGGPLLWGFAAAPMALGMEETESRASEQMARENEEAARRSHLRSASEIVGYKVQARDGPLGKVDDFVVEDDDWSLKGMVVDTREWWPGGRVEVPAEAMEAIDWENREVRLRVTREALEGQAAAR